MAEHQSDVEHVADDPVGQRDHFFADGAGVQQVAEQFSAREIYAFAEAANQVAKITQAWTPKIEGAPSATLANQYKQKAVSQMQQAILASGLTMDKYQYIGKAAKRDPMLREEIRELVDEMN